MGSNNHHNHPNKANNNDESTKKSVSTPPPQVPKLSLLSLKSHEYDHHGHGSQTPPFYTLQASVPFRWEEQPGKPFPSNNVEGGSMSTSTLDIKSLELPPRLLKASGKPRDKTSSPTTVLEGPYPSSKVSRLLLESSSFRFLKKRQQGVSYYDGSVSFSGVRGSSPENRGLLGALLVSENISNKSESWRKSGDIISLRGLNEVDDEDKLVFSNLGGCHGGATVQTPSRKRNGRLNWSLAKTHFWATIYGAFKNVIPSTSTKWKKDAL